MPAAPILNPAKGIRAKLVCQPSVTVSKKASVPDRLPAYLQVTAILQNTTRSDFSLQAPTPSDVNFWELYDDSGRLVQTELGDHGPQHVVNAALPAAGSIRMENSITLNGRLLLDGEKYTVRYKFWGYYSDASFTARCLE